MERFDSVNTLVAWGAGGFFRSLTTNGSVALDHLVDGDREKWGSKVGPHVVQDPAVLFKQLNPLHTVVLIYSDYDAEIQRSVADLGPFTVLSVKRLMSTSVLDVLMAARNSLVMTPPDFLLRDNVDLSQAAFEDAVRLRDKLAKAVELRDAYVIAHHLDPAFCLPAANWALDADNELLKAYRHVRDGDYEVLNRMRFWVQFFSGYSLMWLQNGATQSSIRPIPRDHDDWLVENRPTPDRWINLWLRYAWTVPSDLRFSPPKMLGEIGWLIDGIVVSHDTYVYQERINILYEAGIIAWLRGLGRRPRILEIGGGYGALALALRRILPDSFYVICDLPESLMFSGLYLSMCAQDKLRLIEPDAGTSDVSQQADITLLPNYMFQSLIDDGTAFDLVINTLSMSEMSALQVNSYVAGIAHMIGDSGVFFEQNQDNRHLGMLYCKEQIRPHFSWNLRLEPKLAAGTEGKIDLWSNRKPEHLSV